MIMAKKSAIKMDDLVEAVQDTRVLETLVERLTPIFKAIFADLTKEFVATLECLIEKLTAEKLAASKESSNTRMAGLEQKLTTTNEVSNARMTELEEENCRLYQRVGDLETHSRLNNLIIHGIPESLPPEYSSGDLPSKSRHGLNQDTTQAVIGVCRVRLGITISESEIITSHRIHRKDQGGCRPVIVSFANQQTRDMVYRSRTALRRSSFHPPVIPGNGSSSTLPDSAPLYINEHLTKDNAHVYAQARKMVREKKIMSTWTSGGYTFIKLTDNQDERPKKIRTVKDLDFKL